jgi:hypothetical protein
MSYRDALIAERAGYVARGLDARVAQVDAELARIGKPEPEAVADEAPVEAVEETADAGPTENTSRRKR